MIKEKGKADIFSRHRMLWHVVFWIWLYLIDVLIFGVGYENLIMFFKYGLLEMPSQLLFAYATVYWILPRHFRNLHYVETIALLTMVFLATGFLGHVLFIASSVYKTEPTLIDIPKILLRGIYCALKALIFIVFKLVRMWYENQQTVAEMEKNKLESELKMLKDQVNPHFMFNTLNNLYGLIGKNPLHAQESVMGLSGILHYMLYESNHKTVPLQQEIRCIEDYVELEKLRYPGNLSISLNIQEPVRELSIVPLSLFPFVENSFKHGASEIIENAWINIDLSIYKNDFIFKIENSKGQYIRTTKGGIGLSNVRRRLELLYGNDHKLQIIDGEETFLVVLKISLKEMNRQTAGTYESEVSYRGR